MNSADNKCPCCGQAVKSAGIIVSLDSNSLSFNGEVVLLSPALAEIAFVLAARAPLPVWRSYIVERVWGAAEKEPTAKNLDVHICKLRQRIAVVGLRIVTVERRGYRLVPSADGPVSARSRHFSVVNNSGLPADVGASAST